MGCAGCDTQEGILPKGCNNHGGCTTGSCNKLNTFDWLAERAIEDLSDYNIVEVSFKKGARKDFYKLSAKAYVSSGDMVVVDNGVGYDVGRLSLSGQLVPLQMKKKGISADRIIHPVVRRANHRDLERLEEARSMEKKTLVRARAIARMLDLDMKIGDVEYQGDKRKATFYFTANGRVDFRELIRHFAKEFRVKIEMRQIGSRQESSRIGGIGSCGRELCCSTWLTAFKSVSTRAARYQNLSINQSKLSGQCGRLKCCLNYELDLYAEALDHFPMKASNLRTKAGTASLMKVDIFKNVMYYTMTDTKGRIRVIPLSIDRVNRVWAENKKGVIPDELEDKKALLEDAAAMDYADVTGEIELKELPKRRSKRRKGRRNTRKGNHRRNQHPGKRR